MLEEEDAVKEDGEDSQEELDYIEPTAATEEVPLPRGMMVDEHVQNLLQDRERASSEVKANIDDAPSLSGLPLPVEIHLRAVLDERDDGFVIPCKSESTERLRESCLCRLYFDNAV